MSVERAPGIKVVDLFKRAAAALKGAVTRNKPQPQAVQPQSPFETTWTLSHPGFIIEYVEPLEVQLRQAQASSQTDALTGLPNRRAYDTKITEEVERANRYGYPLSVAVVDIDFFKAVNDVHGHRAGDLILQQVAQVLQREFRDTDFVARYGGEEFAVILTGTNGEERGSVTAMERARKAIEDHIFEIGIDGVGTRVTVSIRISSYKPGTDVFKAADGALYQAKKAGRNRTTHAESGPAIPAA